jgi:hypothetical protein
MKSKKKELKRLILESDDYYRNEIKVVMKEKMTQNISKREQIADIKN